MSELQAALEVIQKIGVLGVVFIGGWLLYTRRLRTQGEINEQAVNFGKALAAAEADRDKALAAVISERDNDRKTFEVQLSYVEARRVEEREGRIAAEKTMAVLTDAVDNVAALLQGVKEEVIRGSGGGKT